MAALEVAQQASFDLLLTDLRMPRLDGAELIRRLRSLKPALPVIVMTGQVPSAWESEFHRDGEGPTRLLCKPATLRTILDTVRDVLAPEAAAILPG
jgi:CheY-like chemotaxis protein